MFFVLSLSAQKATNVIARQVGKNIEVTYDLDQMSDVSLSVSTDGGKTFSQPLLHVSGDAGKKISPGSNKKIMWVVLDDRESLVSGNVVFRINTEENSIRQITNGYVVKVNGIVFNFVNVIGGNFVMGATSEQVDYAERSEKPAHYVTLSTFSLGETEVTQELWEYVMGNNPSKYSNPKNPVENVTFKDCQKFINTLNFLLKDQLNGKVFRLPTEAEWEYAARGGNRAQRQLYSGSGVINNVAWYKDNSNNHTHQVKQKQPNELGLYDMSGNVWEWCSDLSCSYSSSAQTNPKGASDGVYRVVRGGSWNVNPKNCRVSCRNAVSNDNGYGIGLRLVLSDNK